jgi:hypothetical protein
MRELTAMLDEAVGVVPAPGERWFGRDVGWRTDDELSDELRVLSLRLALTGRPTDWPACWARWRAERIRDELRRRAARARR